MDPKIEKYLNIIIEGLNRVEEPYYHIKTTYALSGIVRERAFCYELYHQIRCIQTERNEMQLSLNGEIDKRGHLEFDKDDQKNPDFVFHIPVKWAAIHSLLKSREERTPHHILMNALRILRPLNFSCVNINIKWVFLFCTVTLSKNLPTSWAKSYVKNFLLYQKPEPKTF